MRKAALVSTVIVALLFSFSDVALADEGGLPNLNAVGQTGNAEPNGRKSPICAVPGFLIKFAAKEDGPNNDPLGNGLTPGQEVIATCLD